MGIEIMEPKVREKKINRTYHVKYPHLQFFSNMFSIPIEGIEFYEDDSRQLKKDIIHQFEAKLSLIERSRLEDTTRTIYKIELYKLSDLNEDGTPTEISPRQGFFHNEDIKGFIDEIRPFLEDNFPLHNVYLDLIVHSALESAKPKYGYFHDDYDLYGKLAVNFTREVIIQGKGFLHKEFMKKFFP